MWLLNILLADLGLFTVGKFTPGFFNHRIIHPRKFLHYDYSTLGLFIPLIIHPAKIYFFQLNFFLPSWDNPRRYLGLFTPGKFTLGFFTPGNFTDRIIHPSDYLPRGLFTPIGLFTSGVEYSTPGIFIIHPQKIHRKDYSPPENWPPNFSGVNISRIFFFPEYQKASRIGGP